MRLDAAVNTFVPGDYWTPARARAAVEAMASRLATPEFRALLERMGDDFGDTHTGEQQTPSRSPELSRSGITFRRADPQDAPAITRRIIDANLPPVFVEEFIRGFVVAEQAGHIIATGGLEIYENAGFIRSVAVDMGGRGLGLGREIADLLCADAKASGVTDLYLFTQDAWNFWKHVGFVDVPLDAWPPPSHACWQYQFLVSHPEFVEAVGVHSMWKRA
jgi:amino-acid N-acetyltransferase